MAQLHDNWKTLKKAIGDYAKQLPSEKFGEALDSFEASVADFVKKCTELEAVYDKMVAKRKDANETFGRYDVALAKDKSFSGKHGTEWLKFMSSLKKPMITAGTAFKASRTKMEAPLKTMSGI